VLFRSVADDPASDRHDGAGAIGTGADERVVDARDGLEMLVPLSVRHEDRLLGRETGERRFVQAPNGRIGDDEAPGGHAGAIQKRRKRRGQTRRDVNGMHGK